MEISRLLTVVLAITCHIIFVNGIAEPDEYILSFARHDNPLNIKVVEPLSKNYIITLGDWGAAYDAINGIAVQKKVASILQTFYESQKSKGYNLLFIAAVGDNFYWTGQDCQNEFIDHWSNIYGNNLTNNDNIPWLSIYGNHDWGNSDPYALCAWNNTRYINQTTGIPYAANQLNKDKGGCNPDNYYIPDFGYYYRIDQLKFEFIAIDDNYGLCQQGLPGLDYTDCAKDKTDGEKIGCGYMKKIQDATENNLKQRANVSMNNNFMIIQHYAGGQLGKYNNMLMNGRNVNVKNSTIVFGAGGHTHQQQCMHYDGNLCDQIMTGGGGHGNAGNLHGFFVVGFDENSQMMQPYKINDTLISCMPPCGEGREPYTKEEIERINLKYCCQDVDEEYLCGSNFDRLTQC